MDSMFGVDFRRDGTQLGQIELPISTDNSALGVLPIPIAVIRNGDGPVVLLTAGTHGDEYEGPVTLARWIRELPSEKLRGTLIILPTLNLPAVRIGRRTSPVDTLNLNRVYPGDQRGTITSQIAHVLTHSVLPRCAAWIDLHSGGNTLDCIHSANIPRIRDDSLGKRTLGMAKAFGAPIIIIYDDRGDDRTTLGTGARLGIPVMTTELGGAGGLSREGLALCEAGLRNALGYLGVMDGTAEPHHPHHASRLVEADNSTSFVYSPATGLVELRSALGSEVQAGDVAALIHFVDEPEREPVTVRFKRSGLLCMIRPLAKVEKGDCIALLVGDKTRG